MASIAAVGSGAGGSTTSGENEQHPSGVVDATAGSNAGVVIDHDHHHDGVIQSAMSPPHPAPHDDEEGGEATLLVSEFPPPPFYYRFAMEYTLPPPEIPKDALKRGTLRAAAAASRARAEAERLRIIGEDAPGAGGDKTDAILGGMTNHEEANKDDDGGDVVAVFGEIVENPLLVVPVDMCEDPTIVREEVKRLNQQVLQGFVNLVQDLVHRPMENKKTRDNLSHNIFLMLQESNKFREHQSRELLIELLEKQLAQRKKLVQELRMHTANARELLKLPES